MLSTLYLEIDLIHFLQSEKIEVSVVGMFHHYKVREIVQERNARRHNEIQ